MSKIEVTDSHNDINSEELSEKRTNTFCPVCHKPSVNRYLPFCSKRCADIDLNRWFNGVYAIPMAEQDDEDAKTLSKLAKEENKE